MHILVSVSEKADGPLCLNVLFLLLEEAFCTNFTLKSSLLQVATLY